LSKIILNSNCKHVPADGVVRAQNEFKISKCFTYWGGDRKKCNKHRKKFKKGSITLKKREVTPIFYVMKWKWQAYSARNQFLVVTKRYLDCILAETEEGCQRC